MKELWQNPNSRVYNYTLVAKTKKIKNSYPKILQLSKEKKKIGFHQSHSNEKAKWISESTVICEKEIIS